MNAAISEIITAVQIPGQSKFVSSGYNPHKPPKSVAPTVLMLEQQFELKYIVLKVKSFPRGYACPWEGPTYT